MKAKKLKELLANIPDNVEIKMFHPAVGDFVDFDIQDATLMRMTRKALHETINLCRVRDGEPEVTINDVSFDNWGLEEDYFGVDFDENNIKYYETKKIKLICNKTKNRETFDRLGTIRY